MSHVAVIARQWLLDLWRLRRSRDASLDREALLPDLAAALAEAHPGWVFCTEARNHVARTAFHADDLSDLSRALFAWQRENEHLRPAHSALPAPPAADGIDPDELTAPEASWLAYYRRRIAQGADRDSLLSLIRQQAPGLARRLAPPDRSARAAVPPEAALQVLRSLRAAIQPPQRAEDAAPPRPRSSALSGDALAAARAKAAQHPARKGRVA
jgi:hypothetical protein